MITPEDTGAVGDSAPGGRRRPIGAAALVVIGGLTAVGILNSPGPSAVEETTTSTAEEVAPPIDVENFAVEQIVTGEPLDWGLSMAIDDHQPLALFEHDETLYLFTDSTSDDPGGLRAWRSGDGTDWEALGEVIPADHEVTTVDSTVQGLVATSNRLADNALVVWESADAVGWAVSEVTAEESRFHVEVASAVGANETTLVVASNTRYDRERLLEERLQEIGIDLDLSNLSWNLRWVGEDGHQLIVRGPLGIPVLRQPINTLALRDEEREELLSELFDPLGTNVWVRGELEEWQMATIGDTRSIDSILTSPDGQLIAYGSGVSGRVAKISADGIDWERGRAPVNPGEIEEWGSGFVGGVTSPELMISDDGITWRPARLSERFPNQMGWSPTTLGAGEGGVAMIVRGARPLSSLPEPSIQEVTAQDGSVFTVDANGPGFQVFSDDGRHRWTLDGAALDRDTMAIDTVGEAVTLRDPDTGEDLATFEFAEIEKVQRAHAMATLLYEFSEALAFTENGEEWVIQDMAPEIGDNASIALLEVTASRVVAVVRNTVDSILGDAPPGFEVWSAPVP